MIISPVGGLAAYDPTSQMKATERKNDGDRDDSAQAAASVAPSAQPARSAPPPAVKPVEGKLSLVSDKVYDKRDTNKDGTISNEEAQIWESTQPAVAKGSGTSTDNTMAYTQLGKTPAPGTGAPQSSFNLFA